MRVITVAAGTFLLKGLCTVDLLIKVACFVRQLNNIFSIKMSCSKLVSPRRSTVLILPHLVRFPWLQLAKQDTPGACTKKTLRTRILRQIDKFHSELVCFILSVTNTVVWTNTQGANITKLFSP